jgi:hypothetical protein
MLLPLCCAAGLLDGLVFMQGLEHSAREDLASRLVPVEVAPGGAVRVLYVLHVSV